MRGRLRNRIFADLWPNLCNQLFLIGKAGRNASVSKIWSDLHMNLPPVCIYGNILHAGRRHDKHVRRASRNDI